MKYPEVGLRPEGLLGSLEFVVWNWDCWVIGFAEVDDSIYREGDNGSTHEILSILSHPNDCMKKLLIAIGCIVALMVGLLIWQDQSRDYYCFAGGNCFTIWAHGSECYLIPGKYCGIVAPKDDYVLKKDWSRGLGVINDKKHPEEIIVEGDSSCSLVQTKPGIIVFYNDEGGNKEFDFLYTHDKGSYNSDLEYYNVDIEDMYARTNVNHGAGIMTRTKDWGLWLFILFIVCGILLFPLTVVLVFRLMDKLRNDE